jgi:hypothetical protein
VVQAGHGRLGWLTGARAEVHEAHAWLTEWAAKWRHVLPLLADSRGALRYAASSLSFDRIDESLDAYCRAQVGGQYPQHVEVVRAGQHSQDVARQAREVYIVALHDVERRRLLQAPYSGEVVTADELPRISQQLDETRSHLAAVHARINVLTADPVIASQPHHDALVPRLQAMHSARRAAAQADAVRRRIAANSAALRGDREPWRRRSSHVQPSYYNQPSQGGPSLGR